MKDKWTIGNWIALALIVGLIMHAVKNHPATGHQCRWEKCPYKGIQAAQYRAAVTAYVGEEGTDGWCIDLLHLQYPALEYEALEVMLFTNVTDVESYRRYLIGIGYSEQWADVKSQVEFGLRDKDSIYQSIIED